MCVAGADVGEVRDRRGGPLCEDSRTGSRRTPVPIAAIAARHVRRSHQDSRTGAGASRSPRSRRALASIASNSLPARSTSPAASASRSGGSAAGGSASTNGCCCSHGWRVDGVEWKARDRAAAVPVARACAQAAGTPVAIAAVAARHVRRSRCPSRATVLGKVKTRPLRPPRIEPPLQSTASSSSGSRSSSSR